MAQTNLIGKNILGYTVSEKIGSGAFGTVYKVIKTNAAGQYIRALKHITIPTEKQYTSVLNSMGGDVSKADSYFSKMLNNIVSEIKILNDLSEKGVQHIVRYYENDILITDCPKRYDIFILMEYLTPLEDYIQSKNFLVRDVVKLGLDILHGLQSCHINGVIHRDIKDDNIFVSDKGEYKIGDFGVSKILKDSSKAESLKGTPNFIAPEVYLGKEGYTKCVDLYSLGIVLYRLLNYNRNPFLPPFPEQYFSQDEDVAFEKRMSGKIPDLPVLGGEEIGRVIVKAISNCSERFQTAQEFIDALESAVNNTNNEILDQKITLNEFFDKQLDVSLTGNEYKATLGEVVDFQEFDKTIADGEYNSINQHLFDTIKDVVSTAVPEKTDDMNLKQNTANVICSGINSGLGESSDLDKKIIGKFVFFIPAIIFFLGIAVYFVVVPKMYETSISFIDWLFTNPQNIIDTIRNHNVVLPRIHSIIGIKIFWWIWLTGLIISLFFVGKQFQRKCEPDAINAILTKKEPYLMVKEVTDTLKLLKMSKNNNQLDSLIYSVKKLEERLFSESDFGYGKKAVIDCENSIAQQIQFLLDTVSNLENGDFENNLKLMNTAVVNINALLRKRIELKKK